MWNLKYDTDELIYKTETDSQKQKQTCGCQEEGVGGRINGEFRISRYKPLYIEWANNKVTSYNIRG